jgi:histidinol phosphatase-like enzyme
LLPGSQSARRRRDFHVLITNQSAIGRGLITEADGRDIRKWIANWREGQRWMESISVRMSSQEDRTKVETSTANLPECFKLQGLRLE